MKSNSESMTVTDSEMNMATKTKEWGCPEYHTRHLRSGKNYLFFLFPVYFHGFIRRRKKNGLTDGHSRLYRFIFQIPRELCFPDPQTKKLILIFLLFYLSTTANDSFKWFLRRIGFSFYHRSFREIQFEHLKHFLGFVGGQQFYALSWRKLY